MDMPYSIFLLQDCHTQQVTKFVSEFYVKSEPLCLHIGSSSAEFQQNYRQLFEQSCKSGLSFGMRDSQQNRLIAVITALSYEVLSQPLKTTKLFACIQALIQKQQVQNQPADPTTTAGVFIGCTHPTQRGKGCFYKLVQQFQKAAIQKGFRTLKADCTNRISEHVFVKAGFKAVSKINYDEFEFQGKRPFENMQGSDYLSCVVKQV